MTVSAPFLCFLMRGECIKYAVTVTENTARLCINFL